MSIECQVRPVTDTNVTSQLLSALNAEQVAVYLLDGEEVHGRIVALSSKNYFDRVNLTVPARVEAEVVLDTSLGQVYVPLNAIASTLPI